ncbi:type II secretion system F family protein [Lentilactobacillus sp. Marseille-Q4993]|uniref:type II secretion system F family protein n=1 Tax=Lentilactobacillus sp. Marseille-Q4993 TaxID=3039492 RepID=UPI0024BC2A2D|nr:type II secretion system F family protein [Lentilactobacillus sp. Marseille-Q4993]
MKNSKRVKRWNSEQEAKFFGKFAELLSVGFTMDHSLRFIAQTDNQIPKQIDRIRQQLRNGMPLSESLKSFVDDELLNQIKISEHHGNLVDAMKELSKFSEDKNKQVKKIKSLLVYPLFLILLLGILVFSMQMFILPQINSLMGSKGRIGSPITPLIWLLVVGVIGFIFISTIKRKARVEQAKILLRCPVFGKIYREYLAYYFSFNLAVMMANGLAVKEIVIILRQFDKGTLIRALANEVDAKLHLGVGIGDSLKATKIIPDEVINFLATGTSHEEMAKSLRLFSKIKFEEMTKSINRLVEMIQPGMFCVIGLMIVGSYFQLLMPIYKSLKGLY